MKFRNAKSVLKVVSMAIFALAFQANAADTTALRSKLCRPGIPLPYKVIPTFPDEASTSIQQGPYDHLLYAYSPGLQFGYEPRFNPKRENVATHLEVPRVGVSEISLAPTRRPMIRDNHMNIRVLEDDGSWSLVDLKKIVETWASANGKKWHGPASNGYSVDRRVVVTNDCHIYTIARGLLTAANLPSQYAYTSTMLLHSKDGGTSWQVVELKVLGGYPTARIEFPANGAILSRPPAIITHAIDGGYGRDSQANSHDLNLYVPKLLSNGDVDVGAPKLISNQSILGPYHANPVQIVSFGDKITVLYATTRLGTTNYPGLCTAAPGAGCYGTQLYARTFHGSQNRLGEERYIGTSATASLFKTYEITMDGVKHVYSAADSHNQPTAAVDSKGVMHVVLGAHAGVLQYAVSKGIGQADEGFSEPKPIAYSATNPLSKQYTYATMAIDYQDTLHLVARASYGFRLHYLRKKVGETDFTSPFADRALIDANGTGETGSIAYIHYNQKLSIDPWGRMWLVVTPIYGEMNLKQRDAYRAAYSLPTMTPSSCREKHPTICAYVESSVERISEVYVSYDRGNKWTLATTASFYR